MLTQAFAGLVTETGALKVPDRAGFIAHLKSLQGEAVEVIVRKPASRRSLQINAYWHAVPFAILAEHWGTGIEETKLLLLGECFGWQTVRGIRLPVKIHTSELTKDEAHMLTEWMPTWAAIEFGVSIPLPGEVDWEAA